MLPVHTFRNGDNFFSFLTFCKGARCPSLFIFGRCFFFSLFLPNSGLFTPFCRIPFCAPASFVTAPLSSFYWLVPLPPLPPFLAVPFGARFSPPLGPAKLLSSLRFFFWLCSALPLVQGVAAFLPHCGLRHFSPFSHPPPPPTIPLSSPKFSSSELVSG